MTRTYRVIVSREDGAWLAEVAGLQGVQTWARNLSGLDRYVREAIALAEDLTDGAEADLRIDYEHHTGHDELDCKVAEARTARERVERERRELARQTEELAQTLVYRHHFSVRDAATMTGVSMQRISQLAGKKRRTSEGPRQPGTTEGASAA